MATINIRVVVFQEGDAWVAQALEYDIGAQATDLQALERRFAMTLRAELEESLKRGRTPFGGIDPAPEYFHKMWDGDSPTPKFKASGSMTPRSGNAPPVGYEMLLAA